MQICYCQCGNIACNCQRCLAVTSKRQMSTTAAAAISENGKEETVHVGSSRVHESYLHHFHPEWRVLGDLDQKLVLPGTFLSSSEEWIPQKERWVLMRSY
ncbi:hypothetical protein BDL97_13G086800 [Sphagnum fallax]|nr:hypothetical protein BDL97_13G086800 [Sphagnum fallax]